MSNTEVERKRVREYRERIAKMLCDGCGKPENKDVSLSKLAMYPKDRTLTHGTANREMRRWSRERFETELLTNFDVFCGNCKPPKPPHGNTKERRATRAERTRK